VVARDTAQRRPKLERKAYKIPDFIVVWRALVVMMFIYSIVAYVRVRGKPVDWIPPRIETWHWLGVVDRSGTRAMRSRACS
jgi:hypothetical protein